MKRVLTYIVIVMSLCSCFDDVAYDTNFVLIPTVQYASGGEFESYADCVAYAFDADADFWEVTSWENACDGVLTSKEDPNVTMLPFEVARSYDDDIHSEPMLSMNLDRESVMIVVAHTTSEDYSYMSYSVGVNIPTVYGYVRFRPWKEGFYSESSWIYYSPEIEEETEDDNESVEE